MSEQDLKLLVVRLPLLRISSDALELTHLLGKYMCQFKADRQLLQSEYYTANLSSFSDILENVL